VGKQFADGDNPPLTVVGIVGNVHYGSLEKPYMMQYYRLITAEPFWANKFVIRTAYNPESLAPLVQKSIWSVDPSEPVTHVQTMEHLLNAMTLQRKFETGVVTGFAGMALFLSALGLFGVASLSASRRTREFGIRLALGAKGSQIVRLELARSFAVAAIGLIVGLLASLGVSRAIAALLYQVSPWNMEIFSLAAIVLAASATIAGLIPAACAARTDPAAALRVE
jgi:ABC-type antimicrobial peptide transport system permease subunit